MKTGLILAYVVIVGGCWIGGNRLVTYSDQPPRAFPSILDHSDKEPQPLYVGASNSEPIPSPAEALDLRGTHNLNEILGMLQESLEDDRLPSILLTQLESGEFETVLDFLDATSPRADVPRDSWQAALFKKWAEREGETAILVALDRLPLKAARKYMPSILGAWAKSEPRAAFDWLERESSSSASDHPDPARGASGGAWNLPGSVAISSRNSILTMWAMADPDAALEQADRIVVAAGDRALKMSSSPYSGIVELVGLDIHREPLLDHILSLAEPAREAVMKQMASAWTSMDPQEFAEWMGASELAEGDRSKLEHTMLAALFTQSSRPTG